MSADLITNCLQTQTVTPYLTWCACDVFVEERWAAQVEPHPGPVRCRTAAGLH